MHDGFDAPPQRSGCGCCAGLMSSMVSLLIALVGGLIVLATSFGPELWRSIGPVLDTPDPVEAPASPAPDGRDDRKKGGKKGKSKGGKRR